MARFSKGDVVRVKSYFPPCPPTHCRTPYYIRGCTGKIERICGEFDNPEELAYGRKGIEKPTLYRVRFYQTDVWPSYQGPKSDQLDVEVYEFWLEPATRVQIL